MTLGEMSVIAGVTGTPRQLLKPIIAVQVQPDNTKLKAATKPMRSQGKGSAFSMRQERIPPPLASVLNPRPTILVAVLDSWSRICPGPLKYVGVPGTEFYIKSLRQGFIPVPLVRRS